jgi:hypothetical protein
MGGGKWLMIAGVGELAYGSGVIAKSTVYCFWNYTLEANICH